MSNDYKKYTPFPPSWADRLLEFFCAPHLLEEVQGDLHELFSKWVEEYGERKANRLYFIHALKFFRPFAIEKISFNLQNPTIMFRNYYIIALRNLLKQKLYSLINIGGLAVGLACFLMILLFVQHEISYDKFFLNSDQIYRVIQRQPGNEFLGSDHFAVTPAPLAIAMVNEFPEVLQATSIREQTALISRNNQHFREKGLMADANFFEVFTTPLLHGNHKAALSVTNSIVLTASLSKKIFGDKDPTGESIVFQNRDTYTITGVMPDLPVNSSLQYKFITTIQSNIRYAENIENQNWSNNSVHTFFVLAKDANPQQLQNKLPGLIDKYRKDESYPFQDEYYVHPLSGLHLQSGVNFDIGLKGDKKYVYLLSMIAIIILLLACINYVNLAMARSIKRSGEVGIRKAIGAPRKQLLFQFLGESIFIAFLAFVLSIILVQLFISAFSQLVERPIELNLLKDNLLLPGVLVLIVAVGILSGIYPALFMSSLQPVKVLKGRLDSRNYTSNVQRVLIIGQYAISIALVAGSLIIYKQLQYVQQKELGYDRDHVVTIQVTDSSLVQNYEVIRNELLSNSHIIAVTASNSLPTNITSSTIINLEQGGGSKNDLHIYENTVHFDFLEVFGIQLLTGRNFLREIASDAEQGYLINETAAQALGLTPQEAIGKQFTHDKNVATIIGVVNDFHMHAMHMKIEPLMMRINTSWFGNISVKAKPEELSSTIALLERTASKYSTYPFEYQFLDEHFDQLYKKEIKLGETFGFFTILALLIASLGLFGLAAFTAEQRIKEIGIRKVMGASVQNIVTLLAKNFLGMVGLAFLVAIPIAWYAMDQWLQDFAYRIDIEWWMFASAGLLAVVIAFLTVSFQSFKAAIANPVNSLKNE